MVEKMSEYIIDKFLYKGEQVIGDEREIMCFGITRILEDIPKYLTIFFISLFLNILPLVGIVLAVTIAYKTFVGGAHARTNIICFISSIIIFLAPVLISKYIEFNTIGIYFLHAAVLISSIYIILKIAPADTEEIPILKKNKRKRLKIFASISFLLLYFVSVFMIKDKMIANIILFTILFINLAATNVAYKFFKCKHSYESEEFKQYYNT
ncbi:MAG: accessory gene regulator B family protein [Clostridia bacterium]|nr:accessory gene regulator B family protein [Clostridia bacterium]